MIAALVSAAIIAALVAVSIGPVPIAPASVIGIIGDGVFSTGRGDWSDSAQQIVWGTRLPRVAMALVAGAVLAVSGAMLQALVRNSLAAMEDRANPVLTLSTRRFGPFVEVAVRDTGGGIDVALQGSLFEPFHPSTTSGMGIGLSLCRSIVEAHGGRIGVRPVADGAEMTFTLKIADGETDG